MVQLFIMKFNNISAKLLLSSRHRDTGDSELRSTAPCCELPHHRHPPSFSLWCFRWSCFRSAHHLTWWKKLTQPSGLQADGHDKVLHLGRDHTPSQQQWWIKHCLHLTWRSGWKRLVPGRSVLSLWKVLFPKCGINRGDNLTNITLTNLSTT